MTTQSNATKKQNGGFFKGVKAEMKKVSWPNRKELINSTGVVIAVCLIAAAFIGILDAVFQAGLKFFM